MKLEILQLVLHYSSEHMSLYSGNVVAILQRETTNIIPKTAQSRWDEVENKMMVCNPNCIPLGTRVRPRFFDQVGHQIEIVGE